MADGKIWGEMPSPLTRTSAKALASTIWFLGDVLFTPSAVVVRSAERLKAAFDMGPL